MLFDWSAECSTEDPVLVIPWQDPSGQVRFVDLRQDPDALDLIPEVEEHPALLNALRALNAPRSPVFTAKCDVWQASPQECDDLRLNLLLEPEESTAATMSYLDLLCRDRALFTSFHQHQHLMQRLERRLAPLDQPFASAEIVIRPALLDLTSPQEGFSFSLYVRGVAADATAAHQVWSEALAALTTVLRSREFIPQT